MNSSADTFFLDDPLFIAVKTAVKTAECLGNSIDGITQRNELVRGEDCCINYCKAGKGPRIRHRHAHREDVEKGKD